MELGEFTKVLQGMTHREIHAVAAGLDAYHQSTAGEVDAWHAIVHVDRELRRTRRVREAALVSMQASQAVVCAAEHAHIALPDAEVTRVARAAADVARGLLVHEHLDASTQQVLTGWAALFTTPFPLASAA